MSLLHPLCLILLAGAASASEAYQPVALGKAVPSFQAPDAAGTMHRLDDWKASSLVAVVFIGVDCPLVELYANVLARMADDYRGRVQFVAVDSNWAEQAADLKRFADEHKLKFPLVLDKSGAVADLFSAERTPEVFLLDQDRRVRYAGRIDDQYVVGARKDKPVRDDLKSAIDELLAGKTVSVPSAPSPGCRIARQRSSSAAAAITYSRHIAPLIQKHCVDCHRPGSAAPFALVSYRDVAGRAETIGEIVGQGLMPPWHSDAPLGVFANDRQLSTAEKQLLQAWINSGCPEGEPIAEKPLPPKSEWSIPKPDLIVSMKEPFHVPAEGVVEYQFFEVDPGFKEDKWIAAAELQAGNPLVVHHSLVLVRGPKEKMPIPEPVEDGVGYFLAAGGPGILGQVWPPGTAKRIPAGSKLIFNLHYTPIGTPQTDVTRLALKFADASKPLREVTTRWAMSRELRIPPYKPDYTADAYSTPLPASSLLFMMLPHMHVRGKSFRFEAIYPDGRRDQLLNVPRYDSNWQSFYEMSQPRFLPKGTVVRCTAVYDNSTGNPNNPDPSKEVLWGQQIWDEMLSGYFDVVVAEIPETWPEFAQRIARAGVQRLRQPTTWIFILSGMLIILWMARRSRPPAVGGPAA